MPDYSLGDVARILKVSPRRLRYWQKTELVEALASEDLEEGYGFRDLVCLRAIVSLVDKGIPLQRIRSNLEALRARLPELDDPAAALTLLDEETRRLVVRHDGRLEEAGGQLLLAFGGDEEDERAAVSTLSDRPEDLDATFEKAAQWFERGCELDADPSGWDEAIEAYGRAIELAPDYADAYCNLGAVWYNQGQRTDAREAFADCLAHEPDHVEANFNLANVLEEEGEDDLALEHYRRALASDPLYPDLHINLALLYEKVSRPVRAHGHWRRYLQLEPHGPWAEVARLRIEREKSRKRPWGVAMDFSKDGSKSPG